MREYKDLTIFFVSYYSKKNIKKILKEYFKNYGA